MYASGAGGARNFSSDLPADLVLRELALGDRIIATAAKRPDVSGQVSNALWEKVGGQMGRRMSAEELKLLHEPNPDPSSYGEYCNVSITFFREIANLKLSEAGILMRQVLGAK